MAAPKDGGRAALGGLLYQIVAVIGLRAMFENRDEREDELSALLSVNGDIRIEHEKLDSDAIVYPLGASDCGISLVQFKYSRLATPPPIAAAEYRRIVHAFSKSCERQRIGANRFIFLSHH